MQNKMGLLPIHVIGSVANFLDAAGLGAFMGVCHESRSYAVEITKRRTLSCPLYRAVLHSVCVILANIMYLSHCIYVLETHGISKKLFYRRCLWWALRWDYDLKPNIPVHIMLRPLGYQLQQE